MQATATVPPALEAAFSGQVERLVALGYPALAGEPEAVFRARAEALHPALARLDADAEPGGPIPFVLVVRHRLVPGEAAIARVTLAGRQAVSVFAPGELDRFAPIAGVVVPSADLYLCTGIETGAEYRNVTPEAALPAILAAGRSPLTIDEGIAVITQFPGILAERNAFSLTGSRCGDRRVAAIWTSERRPKLGWCWAGNPHSWLGTASCAGRAGY